jgi:serine protease Do
MTRPPERSANSVVSSSDPMNVTVALVTDKDMAYCAGTWVGSDRILTASHCVIDDGEAATSVHVRDFDGVVFEAQVKKVDRRVDLVLLVAPHAHAWASVAITWHKGEELTIVGHPAHAEWAFMRGWISLWLKHDSPESAGDMGMLQVQAPIYYGNSGGGAFDADGNLVGVCSMRSTSVPDLGLFVAPEEISAFLL